MATAQAADPNVNLLSYYTDAGDAYMNGAKGRVLAAAIAQPGLPYGLVQLDDWSHASTGGPNCGCLSRWAANERYFGAV